MSSRCVFFFLFIFCVADVFAQAIANPDVPRDSCPYRIIFALDESGSVSGTRATEVRNGARNFVAGMIGSGTQFAVVEFNSSARRAIIGGTTNYQVVDANYYNSFNTYISCGGGGAAGYCPGGGTNIGAAFNLIASMNTSSPPRADLVVIFTDGVTGGNPTTAANAVKAQGTHIFAIGFLGTGVSVNDLRNISGTDELTPSSTGSFLTFDYSLQNGWLTPQCR